MTRKIITLDKLPISISYKERRRAKVVHAHGCFDILHYFHCLHLEQAKSYGDILIVTLTSDQYVGKDANRPIFSEDIRTKMVAFLPFVDYVAISDYPDASTAIRIINPNIYVKGIDYKEIGIIESEKKALSEIGAELMFTTTKKYSTTEILEKLKA